MGSKGEATRHRLIKTARKLFHAQGFAATSIDDICRQAGVNRGNLYFHFKSKDELAAAALKNALDMEMPFLEEMMAGEPDPLGRLELMIRGIVDFNVTRGGKGG